MKTIRILSLAVGMMVWLIGSAPVWGGTFTINARANIFGAGHPPPGDAPGGSGVPPVVFTFPAQSNQVVTFSQVSGSISFGGTTVPNGPDGGNFPYRVASLNGISGTRAPVLGYLAGVFLDDSEPADPAPPTLDFTAIGTNFPTLAPQLRQVFYIGDGLTQNGQVQRFEVPPTATRLFLGLADACHPGDTPNCYDDNTGWFEATVELTSPAPTQPYAVTGSAAPSPSFYVASTQTPSLPHDDAFGYALPNDVGLSHTIESSTDLLHWEPATNVVLYFKDMGSLEYGKRFYRFREK